MQCYCILKVLFCIQKQIIISIYNIMATKKKDLQKLFKFYSKIILWQRYASWLRAYRPCIHSQWSVS